MSIRVTIKAFGQKDICSEMHWPAPEPAEQLALHLYVLDVFRVFGRLDGWNNFVKDDLEVAVIIRPHGYLLRGAVEISRCATPLLALASIHRELNCVPIGSLKRFIAMKERLHPIIPRLQL